MSLPQLNDSSSVSELHTRNINASEPSQPIASIHVTVSEPCSDNPSVSEPHTHSM